MQYEAIAAGVAEYPVALMGRVLGVAPSGYYRLVFMIGSNVFRRQEMRLTTYRCWGASCRRGAREVGRRRGR